MATGGASRLEAAGVGNDPAVGVDACCGGGNGQCDSGTKNNEPGLHATGGGGDGKKKDAGCGECEGGDDDASDDLCRDETACEDVDCCKGNECDVNDEPLSASADDDASNHSKDTTCCGCVEQCDGECVPRSAITRAQGRVRLLCSPWSPVSRHMFRCLIRWAQSCRKVHLCCCGSRVCQGMRR
jgi:hypothetical protein